MKNLAVLLILIFLFSCSNRQHYYTNSELGEIYKSNNFHEISFQHKRIAIFGFRPTNDTVNEDIYFTINTSFQETFQKKTGNKDAHYYLAETSPTEQPENTIATDYYNHREEMISNFLDSAEGQYDYLLEYRLKEWSQDQTPKRTNMRCQLASTYLQLSVVFWEVKTKEKLWQAKPDSKMNARSCIRQNNSDYERKLESDNLISALVEILIKVFVEVTVELAFNEAEYHSMKPAQAPQISSVVDHIVNMVISELDFN